MRAWDFDRPRFFALAMNTLMYEHFLTGEQRELLLKKFGFIEIPTIEKLLACGDYGNGALATPQQIFDKVDSCLNIKN